jgi:hypothetical protein
MPEVDDAAYRLLLAAGKRRECEQNRWRDK